MIVERGTIFYVGRIQGGGRERWEGEGRRMWKYSKVILQLLKIIGRNFLYTALLLSSGAERNIK